MAQQVQGLGGVARNDGLAAGGVEGHAENLHGQIGGGGRHAAFEFGVAEALHVAGVHVRQWQVGALAEVSQEVFDDSFVTQGGAVGAGFGFLSDEGGEKLAGSLGAKSVLAARGEHSGDEVLPVAQRQGASLGLLREGDDTFENLGGVG